MSVSIAPSRALAFVAALIFMCSPVSLSAFEKRSGIDCSWNETNTYQTTVAATLPVVGDIFSNKQNTSPSGTNTYTLGATSLVPIPGTRVVPQVST